MDAKQDLQCLDTVLADPPPTLVTWMQAEGSIVLHHQTDEQTIPYTNAAYVNWLTDVRILFQIWYDTVHDEADEWENLTLMTDQDIDYRLIPERILQKLPLGSELYIATSALVELHVRDSNATAALAWAILATSHGDRYLWATALGVLFAVSRPRALTYIREQAPNCDSYLLNTIMELMLENEPVFRRVHASVIQTVLGRLSQLGGETDCLEPDVKNRFLALYQ